MISRALISVYSKDYLPILAKALVKKNVEIISSGKTAAFLREQNIPVIEVSQYTGSLEILEGRVKTLHPKIHAGILAKRNKASHQNDLTSLSFPEIDLVVVNLYPFEETLRKKSVSIEDLLENIDIGGPTLIRAAAKNYEDVTVLTHPQQYDDFIQEFLTHQKTSLPFRQKMAKEAFECTASYEVSIAKYFQSQVEELPNPYFLNLKKKSSLRYGENPHQKASFFLPSSHINTSLIHPLHQGKELSYNNLLDLHAATMFILDFLDKPHVVGIFKHTNPCGVGISSVSLEEAYQRAFNADPTSAFGGIVIFSQHVNEDTAKICTQTFTEMVIVPSLDKKALAVFQKKKNLRVVEIDFHKTKESLSKYEIQHALDGFLIQSKDHTEENIPLCNVATERKPTKHEYQALELAWKVVKHVKSNAIVLAHGEQTLGIGAGQMSRVDAIKLALQKCSPNQKHDLALASDAFFPFRDNIDAIANKGITCVIQPGGSIRDQEIIDAANEYNLAMVFTHVRHFKHS